MFRRSLKCLSIIYENSYYYKSTMHQFPTKIYHVDNQINYKYAFLGIIKQVPHYINEQNEVFIKDENKYQYFKYVSHWCNLNKMPYSLINPQRFRQLQLENEKYFYDSREYDTYYYDVTKQRVYYKGRYDPKSKMIKFSS